MKRVLIYRDSLLPISETFIAAQARALRSYDPIFVGLQRTDPCLPLEFKTILLTDKRRIQSRKRSEFLIRLCLAPAFYTKLGRAKAELMHAHFAPDGVRGSRISKHLGIPLIVSLHGYDVTTRQDFKTKYAKLWKEASLFVCVSEFIRRKAIEAGFPLGKLITHYTGIDKNEFVSSAEKRVPGLVLFVGRLVEKKGCEVLIRAMEYVSRQAPNAHLLVVGDGPLRPALSELGSQIKAPIRFAGALSPEQVRYWMRKATVFCVPSLTAANGDSEGFGMVFLEAQACGTPVVSTLHGGIPEAVRNMETGTLTQEGKVDELADAIVMYLTQPKLAAEHGARGQLWVKERFDLSKQTDLLEDIYEQVITQRS